MEENEERECFGIGGRRRGKGGILKRKEDEEKDEGEEKNSD